MPGSGGAHGGEFPSANAAIAKMQIKRTDVASFFRFFMVFSKVRVGLASFLHEQDRACFRAGDWPFRDSTRAYVTVAQEFYHPCRKAALI